MLAAPIRTMSNQKRHSQGQPTGGQFAAHQRGESSVALLDPPKQTGDYEDVERHDWLGSSYTVAVNKATGLSDDEFTSVVDNTIGALLWSTTDLDDGDTFLDSHYNAHDIAPEARADIEKRVNSFLAVSKDLIAEARIAKGYDSDDGTGPLGMIGHDIALTSGGHGAGFWDRAALRAGSLGDKLSEYARLVPAMELYPGDDGQLYL